jgi:outer membrane protein
MGCAMTVSLKRLFAVLCFVLLPMYAQATEPDALLLQAQKLLADKNYPALDAILAPLLDEREPPLEALFLSGMAARQQGEFDTAATRFRAMLTRDPSLIRPRLELARTLQLAGDRQAAIYNYEQVLSASLPDVVRRNIYAQLNDIRLREPSLRFTVEIVSDTNPQQTTSSKVVFIGGRPYSLNNANQGQLQWGMAATVGGIYPLPADPSWFVQFFGQAYQYPGHTLDNAYAQSTIGKRFEFGANELTLSLGGQVSTVQGNKQYDGLVARATGLWTISPNLAWKGEASINTYNYPNLPYLNGELSTLGLTAMYIPNPTQRWELGAFIGHNAAAEGAYSYWQPGVNLFASQEWSDGWITGLRLLASKSNYAAPDPFFGAVRKDTEGRVELILGNRKLRWYGVSPLVTVGYVQRNSTLEINSYDRLYGRVGLTTLF